MVYKKGTAVSVSANFTSIDFDCHCKRPECAETIIHPALPPALDVLWGIVGPFKIDSGYRCPAHNAEIGGAKDSEHPLGKASDCKSLNGKAGPEMAAAAEHVPQFYSGGIGTYPTFAHCDVRSWQARWKSGIKSSLIIPC